MKLKIRRIIEIMNKTCNTNVNPNDFPEEIDFTGKNLGECLV